MRSRIILLIILVSIILLAIVMFHGVTIGELEIFSISQLVEKNKRVDGQIDKVSELTSIDYPKNIETLESSFQEYTIKKEKYEELTGKAIGNKDEMYETKQYDITYLWRVIGKYAKNRNLILEMNVQFSNENNNAYDLNFRVLGEYVNIIQFITDIEDDSDLYFRIYDFKMNRTEDEKIKTIESKFIVKNISINPDTLKNSQITSVSLNEENDISEEAN